MHDVAYQLPINLDETCDGMLYCLARWVSDITFGLYWAAMLLAFCLVLFLATQRFGSARSYGFSAVMGLFGAIWLATLQLIAWWIATLFILAGAVGLAVMLLNEK